jgi:uncharacterized protein
VKIRVHDIKDKSAVLAADEQVVNYPSVSAIEARGEAHFLAPLSVRLEVAKEYDHIRVHGQVGTTVRMNCSRCMVETDNAIASSFTIFYRKSTGEPQDEEEVELAEEDLIAATYEGDEIDFSDEIAEQVLMAIPFKPLCSDDCQGLCSSCGADLNVSKCGCDRQEMSLKFSALKNFKVDN